MAQITLEILAERFDNLEKQNKEDHNTIIEWLKRNNGDTAKNTKWRHYLVGGVVVGNAIIVPIIVAIALKVL